jgi:hypothetical protein
VYVGFVEGLLDARVGDPGYIFDLLEQPSRELLIPREVVADDLNVDGSGQTKVQNLADDVGRQEREGHAGKLFGQTNSQIVNVLSGLVVIHRESGQDICV